MLGFRGRYNVQHNPLLSHCTFDVINFEEIQWKVTFLTIFKLKFGKKNNIWIYLHCTEMICR